VLRVETNDRLVLVDTGFGMNDITNLNSCGQSSRSRRSL